MSLGDERRWARYMQQLEHDDNGCWLWTGKIKLGRTGGYGLVQVAHRTVRVHRLFYEHFVGPIPEGLFVLHRCDVPRCVNPEHLYAGTHTDNMIDMATRGRRRRTHCPKGHSLGDAPPASDGSRCAICRHDRANRYARRVRAGMAAMVAIAVVMIPLTGRTAGESVRRGDHGPLVAEVQTILAGMGYSVVVDSDFGPQTARAVKAWQTSNGLEADAIVGPITLDSLRQAVRVGNAHMVGGLNGLPFAPADLTGCDEMRFYRQQAGLPDAFDAIGYRESRCRNDVVSSIGCCFGYWQNYISSHLSRWSAYRQPIIDRCQVTGLADIYGNDPLQKQKQACVTAVVYQISGLSPWRATT